MEKRSDGFLAEDKMSKIIKLENLLNRLTWLTKRRASIGVKED